MTGSQLLHALQRLTPEERDRHVMLRISSPFESTEGALNAVTVGADILVGLAVILTAKCEDGEP
jgi:hypothetical protein